MKSVEPRLYGKKSLSQIANMSNKMMARLERGDPARRVTLL